MDRSSRPLVIQKLALTGIVVAAVLAAGWTYARRNVHHVTVRPGQLVFVTVELPMGQGSFAKEFDLPVECKVSAPGRDGAGVRIAVASTGHKVRKMWAKLGVSADRGLAAGTRKRSLEFTIDGQGGWPTVTLIVHVQG